MWLWTGAALTATTLVVGGITRLTESGLSIVDWAPIVGAVPPLNDADWHEAFARYQQYPEYVKLRPGMTLSEFKVIYFWEYLHRNIGRIIGLTFALPFLWFWLRGYFNGPILRRMLFLFGLGAAQGAMGWYMVSSGLVDQPNVSHYRLAAHLLLAVTIFGTCLWFANDLLGRPSQSVASPLRTSTLRTLIGLGALLTIQIFWGGLVAGLKAGFIYGTFPFMNGSLLPPNGWVKHPWVINLVDNHATVQWVHRVVATLLLFVAITFAMKVWRNPDLSGLRMGSAAVAGVIVLQYCLGIATLLTHVKIYIAVTHQMTALLIVGVLLTLLHRVMHSTPEPQPRSIS